MPNLSDSWGWITQEDWRVMATLWAVCLALQNVIAFLSQPWEREVFSRKVCRTLQWGFPLAFPSPQQWNGRMRWSGLHLMNVFLLRVGSWKGEWPLDQRLFSVPTISVPSWLLGAVYVGLPLESSTFPHPAQLFQWCLIDPLLCTRQWITHLVCMWQGGRGGVRMVNSLVSGARSLCLSSGSLQLLAVCS